MVEAVVIGGSAGSIDVLPVLLKSLPKDYPLPVIIVLHLHVSDKGDTARFLDGLIDIRVVEAMEKHPVKAGAVYVAPANYHLLVEHDKTFALSIDEKVNYARPSIDVLFESAAFVYREHLAAVLLTGANTDGALGIMTVKKCGGLTIVEDPSKAKYGVMPRSALDTGCVDRFLSEETMLEILR